MFTEAVLQVCPGGHSWYAEMYWELGGWFYQDEAHADCPACGAEAVDEWRTF